MANQLDCFGARNILNNKGKNERKEKKEKGERVFSYFTDVQEWWYHNNNGERVVRLPAAGREEDGGGGISLSPYLYSTMLVVRTQFKMNELLSFVFSFSLSYRSIS